MDFDHLEAPAFRISQAVNRRPLTREMLEEELAKCELVCSNCHRVRTFQRRAAPSR